MKNLQKSTEILCLSTLGNEPGFKEEYRELTLKARVLRLREIDAKLAKARRGSSSN